MADIEHKKVSPLHPAVLVPTDWDFTFVIESALGGPSDDTTAYKRYDTAVVNWLKHRFIIDGQSLPVIPSAPSNVFANYKKLLEELGFKNKCPKDIRDYAAYPLPMVSVQRTLDDPREGGIGPFPIRSIAFVDSAMNKDAKVKMRRGSAYTRYPKPMWFTYSVNLWALHKQHIAWMKQCLETAFWNKIAHFRVSHPFKQLPQVKQITAIHRDSAEDLTEPSRDERSELIQRYHYTFKVEAWVWDDLLLAPTVLTHTQELTEGFTGEKLAVITIPLTPESPAHVDKTKIPHEAPALDTEA